MTSETYKVIDPHLHLFDRQKGEYHWLKNENAPFWPDKSVIQKNFSEADLEIEGPNQLTGFVHIEAGFDNKHPWREIDWLEKHCILPFRCVAYADITSTNFKEEIRLLTQRKTVVGVRHILDDEANDILASPQIASNFALLEKLNLSFDAQLSLTNTPAIDKLKSLADTHKALKIIINHAGWPFANNQQPAQKTWLENLSKMAPHKNVAIKLSGWEMGDRNWQPHQANQIAKACLRTFGHSRVMFASNFPLCQFSISYSDLWHMYQTLVGDEDYKKLAYENAQYWYRFN